MLIKLLDTFAWVGWFHLALKQSIWKENVKCIGYSEIDKFAKQVYNERFPNTKDLWSITELDIDKLEDFDLLTWWFPCQDVSVAWKQSLEWGRTVLVEYLLQILEKKQPKYFVFENVKGLMSKKFNKFRESIFERIRDAWYNMKYQVLNTKNFWLPQNRERVFMVWSLDDDFHHSFNFPQWQELTIFLKDVLEEEVDEKYNLTEKNLKHLEREFWSKWKNITWKDYIWTLTASMWTWWWNVPYLYNHYNKRIMKDVSWTLSTSMWFTAKQWLTVFPSFRKITPTECARLQWFPDNWSTEFVSNSQAYKQMWNAISVPVVKAIFDNLF